MARLRKDWSQKPEGERHKNARVGRVSVKCVSGQFWHVLIDFESKPVYVCTYRWQAMKRAKKLNQAYEKVTI